MWKTLWDLFTQLWKGRPERIEPIIEGWGELTSDQRELIRLLKVEMVDLRADIHTLKEDIKTCNNHRAELQKRVVKLERQADEEYDYAHENVHNLKDFLLALDEDLKAAGIEPEARSEVLRGQEHRRKQHRKTKKSDPQ